MGFFDALRGKKKVGGAIASYGLEEWWLGEFTDAERKYVQKQYQPLGSPENSLAEGEIWESTQSKIAFVGVLASWFNKGEDRYLAKRILAKAESLVTDATDVLDAHFLYHTKIVIYYRGRENPGSLDMAIQACQQQIDIAPQAARAFKREDEGYIPEHTGYKQLAIIQEKRKDFAGAIALCEKALELGWGGDWEKRIERCQRKVSKG